MANLVGQKIELRVYIEGHLIPCHGFTMTLFDGQPSQGNILTTPTDSVKKIPPMSTVTIFYYDNNFRDWCLLWEGVYVGWQFSRTSTNRSIALTIIDWDILLQKVSSLMIGDANDLLNSQYQVFGSGNSSPSNFGENNTNLQGVKTAAQVDKIKGQIANLALRMFMPRNLMTFEQMAAQIIKTQGLTNFNDLAKTFTEGLLWLNPLVFYRYLMSRMSDKSVAIPDNLFSKFLDADMIETVLMQSGKSSFRDSNTAYDTITQWMQLSMYSKSSCCAPSYFNDGTSKRIHMGIYHPQAFFNIPPACNTLFPEFINSISYANNYIAHATRIVMQTNPLVFGSSRVTAAYYFSERGEYEDTKSILDKMKGLPQNMYMSEFSPEEYEKYVKPAYFTLQNSQYYLVLNKQYKEAGENQKEIQSKVKKSLGALAQYMFLEHKYGNRPLTITGCFNPYFTVGFPCVVLDETCSFMAKPLSITHNINASGDASTSYMMNFAVDFDNDDLLAETPTKKHTKFPPLPAWLPPGYMPENIDSSYETLLGRNLFGDHGHAALAGFGSQYSLLKSEDVIEGINPVNGKKVIDDDSGLLPKRANIAKLSNSIFNINRDNPSGVYDKAEDKLQFARDYVTRPVTTFSQYIEFNGMVTTSAEPPQKLDSRADLFKHIVKIQTAKSGDQVFYNEDLLVNSISIKDYIAGQTTEDSNKTTFEALVSNNKYTTMDSIQEDLQKTGFKG